MQVDTYPTDLTDAQWDLIDHLFPRPKAQGRPWTHSRRTILNAIFYLLRAGCAWRLLPKSFAPWQTVYHYFRHWSRNGLWERIHNYLRDKGRRQAGKTPAPTAAVIDSQTVKMGTQAGERGVDAGKQVVGRKRHLLVDTLGFLLGVKVTAASVQDYAGARLLLVPLVYALGWLQIIWADSAYGKAGLPAFVKALRPFGKLHVAVVHQLAGQVGFAVLPKRWIVERTLGWLMKCRRLVRDYEVRTDHSEAMIQLCMIGVMLRRLCRSH